MGVIERVKAAAAGVFNAFSYQSGLVHVVQARLLDRLARPGPDGHDQKGRGPEWRRAAADERNAVRAGTPAPWEGATGAEDARRAPR